jgi:hypothetical protein
MAADDDQPGDAAEPTGLDALRDVVGPATPEPPRSASFVSSRPDVDPVGATIASLPFSLAELDAARMDEGKATRVDGARIDELHVDASGRLLHDLPPPPPPSVQSVPLVLRVEAWGKAHFRDSPFSFGRALWPMMALAFVLFTRWPGTNYIFDEQEALLANPYVNATGGLGFWDAIHRDFWGLPADRSVGSYRPIPDFLWRSLWQISHAPFFHHLYNVALHAVNAALLAWIVNRWTRQKGLAYLAGFIFLTSAVLTEAVSGIVGIADVLGGLGALLAVAALSLSGPAMPFAVFFALLFGLFCKESALVCVPLVPLAALVAAPLTHPERPARFARALLALVAAAGAFVLYVELRKVWFQSPLPADLATAPEATAPAAKRLMHAALVWFHQAPLPKDPLNNPLAEADFPHRLGAALRVYFRGFLQTLAPVTLSGDYSFPQEPVPAEPWFFESVAGAALMVVPLLASVALWIVALFREHDARGAVEIDGHPYGGRTRAHLGLVGVGAAFVALAVAAVSVDLFVLKPRGLSPSLGRLTPALVAFPSLDVAAFFVGIAGLGLFALGLPRLPSTDAPGEPVPLARAAPILLAISLAWIVVSFFPHSNIPVVLPTVRAERFWYFPAIGTSILYACALTWVHRRYKAQGAPWIGPVLVGLFLGFQSLQAYRHAMDYRSDVDFWGATRESVPESAKAHLNYSVMKGARGDLATRLTESKIALALAPKWPMAHIYTGDTLCRMHHAEDAWPYYKSGFEVGPNELSLIALALQCMWDENTLTEHEAELRDIADKHPGSWIAYLAVDTLAHGKKNNGVAPKYRPRGYNEGPKDKKKGSDEDDDDDDDDASASASASASAAASAKPIADDDDHDASAKPAAKAPGPAASTRP